MASGGRLEAARRCFGRNPTRVHGDGRVNVTGGTPYFCRLDRLVLVQLAAESAPAAYRMKDSGIGFGHTPARLITVSGGRVMHSSRVLLADDHPILAAAIEEYVAEAFQLVGTVQDGGALLEAAKTLKPDVIVADISMPGTDGLTAMKQIQKHLPHVRVILLTNYGDAEVTLRTRRWRVWIRSEGQCADRARGSDSHGRGRRNLRIERDRRVAAEPGSRLLLEPRINARACLSDVRVSPRIGCGRSLRGIRAGNCRRRT